MSFPKYGSIHTSDRTWSSLTGTYFTSLHKLSSVNTEGLPRSGISTLLLTTGENFSIVHFSRSSKTCLLDIVSVIIFEEYHFL